MRRFVEFVTKGKSAEGNAVPLAYAWGRGKKPCHCHPAMTDGELSQLCSKKMCKSQTLPKPEVWFF